MATWQGWQSSPTERLFWEQQWWFLNNGWKRPPYPPCEYIHLYHVSVVSFDFNLRDNNHRSQFQCVGRFTFLKFISKFEFSTKRFLMLTFGVIDSHFLQTREYPPFQKLESFPTFLSLEKIRQLFIEEIKAKFQIVFNTSGQTWITNNKTLLSVKKNGNQLVKELIG